MLTYIDLISFPSIFIENFIGSNKRNLSSKKKFTGLLSTTNLLTYSPLTSIVKFSFISKSMISYILSSDNSSSSSS